MSFLVKKGSFTAEAANGNKAYTGIGFQPDVLLLFATKQTATGISTGEAIAAGFGISSSARRTVAVASDDDVAASNTGRGIRQTGLAVFSDGTPTVGMELDIVSFDTDGFTLNYLTSGPAYIIHYIALGGSDLTNMYIGQQSFSGGGGSVTGVGFQPDFVMMLGDNGTSIAGVTSSFCIGAAAAGSGKGSVAFRSKDAVNPTEVANYQRNDKTAVAIAGGTDTTVEIDITSFDADGFTYTNNTSAQFAFLALKGGKYWVGNDTQKTSTGTKAKTGLGFRPTGLLAFSADGTGGNTLDTTSSKFSLGAGTSGAAQGCIWGEDTDNVSPSKANSATLTNKFLRLASNGPASLLDDFGGTLTKWTQPLFPGDPSNLAIASGQLSSSSAAADGYYNVSNLGPDCFFGVDLPTLPTSASSISLWARIVNENTASISGYAVSWKATTTAWTVNRLDNDAVTQLATGTLAFSAGDSFAIRCVGTTIEMWHKTAGGVWTLLGSAIDGTYSAAGKVGIKIPDTVARVDNAVGATISATTDLLPITNAECDISTFDVDGYTLNWTTADSTAREFIVIAFGSYVDAATVALKLTPSGTDTQLSSGTYTDSGTTYLDIQPSTGAQPFAAVDASTVRLSLISSAVESYVIPGGKLIGAYDGGQNVSGVNAFKAWLGVDIPLASEFLAGDVWGGIEGPGWILDPWNGHYRLNLAVPMLPATEVPSGASDTATISTKLASGATGTFNSHFATLADNLIAKGQADAYIRLGWEFNGNWFIWRADANPTAWKNYWIQIVNTMRARPGANFKFVWNPTRGPASLSGQPSGTESLYPGNAYVDVIGMDIYDTQYGENLTDAARWNRIMFDPYCIDWMLDFAAGNNKQIAFPEWGIVKQTTSPRYGGGDSASFINHMADVILGNDTAYHAYWDYDASDIQSKLSNNSAPNAGAAYILRFGAPPPPPLPPPAPPIPIIIPTRPSQVSWSLRHFDHADNALGDVFPKSPEFAIYLNRVGYCNYTMDLDHPLARRPYTSPYQTDFVLFRGNKPVMGGLHTSVSVNLSDETLNVSGLDWQHYLELREWPFDPGDPLADTYLEADRDVALVVKDILTRVLAEPNSLQVDLTSIVAINHLINYKIDIGDSGDIMSKLTDLAAKTPGFDFEITYDRRFNIYAPHKGSDGGVSLVQSENIYDLAYTDNGPTATHTLGRATAGSTQIGYVVDSSNQSGFRRMDASQDFQDITSDEDLISSTTAESDRNALPHREITCKIVQDALDVWEEIGIGDTIHLSGDIQYDQFNDEVFRVVGMLCNPNDEGDEEWSLTLDDGTLSL